MNTPAIKTFLFRFTLLVLIFIFVQPASAQSWAWAQGEGGPGSDAANSITVDEQGNTYITGNIAGYADFSGTTYQGRGIYDVCIAKYNPQGGLIWVKLAGGDDNESGNAIKYKNGYLYLTGYFNDTTWFNGNMMLSRGGSDAFIAKYDKDGNLIWVKQAGGTHDDIGTCIDVDDAGNIFVAGTFRTSLTLGGVTLTSPNFYDESFYARYDANGNVVWAKATRGNNSNFISGIAFDHDHSFFIAGFFGSSFAIDGNTVNSMTSSYDVFLAKIDINGNFDWLKRAGSTNEDAAHGVCSDLNGNPSITGYYSGIASFDSHTVTYSDYSDVFVARYDSAGNNLWVRTGLGHQQDLGWGIASDDNGNLFATGMFRDNISFDGNIIHAYDDRDIFLISYTPNGNFRWLAQGGGQGIETGFSVAVDNSGLVAVCGYYSHTCYFGTIPVDYAIVTELFIAEYHQPVINGIDDLKDDSGISVYPNPANSSFTVSIDESMIGSTATVTDIAGKTMMNVQLKTDNYHLSTADWQSGIYFLHINGENLSLTQKIIKE